MITSERINKIQDKIKKALAQICKEENVQIDFGNSKYNAAYYRTEMTVTSTEKTPDVQKVLEDTSKKLGMTQNVIGMKFTDVRLGNCTVVSIKRTNHKYPFMVDCDKNGKVTQYKMSAEQVKRHLGGDKLINRGANLDKLLGI